MQVQQLIRAGSARVLAGALVAVLSISGRPVFASGQAPAPPPADLRVSVGQAVAQAQAPAQAPAATTHQLTVDDAVAMALESNLSIKADRLSPQIQDYSVAQARANWAPVVFTGFRKLSDATPPNSFLAGSAATITNSSFGNTTGVQQQLPWGGGNYDVRWSGSRSETTSFTNFNPQLSSSFDVTFTQPLLANFGIDSVRRQVWTSQNLREISDVQLRQNIVVTTRNVRNAYWDLVAAIANLEVAQQALDLARQSLKDNQTRVEVGTMAPIDIIEAEAEVARNEESVIVATTGIERAQDQLRVLISNPEQPDFWTMRIEPTEQAVMVPTTLDVDAAVGNALANRGDLVTARRQLDNTLIDVKYYKNQRMPALDLNLSYGMVGLGGTQFQFADTGFPPEIIGQTERSFGSVLNDVFGNDYKNWSVGFQISYPIGMSTADAGLAQARLQQAQAETNLQNMEMLITTSVRDVARQVTTNQKRVEATQKARELAERRLEAEQKKFNVGLSTTFVVFQLQRDLASQRAREVAAIIDYNKSLVDFEAVQQAPIR